jgi:hypothetical protein
MNDRRDLLIVATLVLAYAIRLVGRAEFRIDQQGFSALSVASILDSL